jgi:hypothetical protein
VRALLKCYLQSVPNNCRAVQMKNSSRRIYTSASGRRPNMESWIASRAQAHCPVLKFRSGVDHPVFRAQMAPVRKRRVMENCPQRPSRSDRG